MGGIIDGTRGDRVMLAPPYILREDQIGEIVSGLTAGLRALNS